MVVMAKSDSQLSLGALGKEELPDRTGALPGSSGQEQKGPSPISVSAFI